MDTDQNGTIEYGESVDDVFSTTIQPQHSLLKIRRVVQSQRSSSRCSTRR
jgi:hypothetical protein